MLSECDERKQRMLSRAAEFVKGRPSWDRSKVWSVEWVITNVPRLSVRRSICFFVFDVFDVGFWDFQNWLPRLLYREYAEMTVGVKADCLFSTQISFYHFSVGLQRRLSRHGLLIDSKDIWPEFRTLLEKDLANFGRSSDSRPNQSHEVSRRRCGGRPGTPRKRFVFGWIPWMIS